MIALSAEAVTFLVVIAFLAGCVDALAGGGGLLTIPALMAAGVPPVSALATNKLQSTIGTSSAFLTFLRARHVDLKGFALPAVGAFLGCMVGGKVLWLLGGGMALANVAGNQIGAQLAIRYGGKGVRPLLVVMSFALTVKLLSDPTNPLWGWL